MAVEHYRMLFGMSYNLHVKTGRWLVSFKVGVTLGLCCGYVSCHNAV